MRLFLVGLIALAGGCAATNTAAPVAGETVSDAAYVAHGNEPFWRLEADGAGAAWITPEGTLRADAAPITAPTPTVPGWRGFSARFDGQALTAEITTDPCQDDMSGQYYPDRVRVRFGGRTYSGCGGETLSLLVGDWRAFIDGREVGTVNIAEGGAVSAHAGCNRLLGALTITGEGLQIGPIAATRMMCGPELMAQEAQMIAALEGTGALAIGADGGMRLVGPEGDRMRLVRP